MLKIIQLGVFALTALLLLSSCNEDGSSEVREAARTSVEKAGNAADAAISATGNAAANAAAAAADAIPTGPTTVMSFEEESFDFGTVTEGEAVKHTYNFKNTGDEPLILKNAKGSCGCTVPQWPREPIAPGASGEIVVEFNSKGKAGDRNQKVTITANTNPAQTFIYLKGKVEKAAAAQ